ncbi:hypothetical protein ACRAWF_24585 [Streptomyces sp. L7]
MPTLPTRGSRNCRGAGPSTVYPALQELRARHRPPMLSYARLCTTHGESAARRLAAQAFTLAAR